MNEIILTCITAYELYIIHCNIAGLPIRKRLVVTQKDYGVLLAHLRKTYCLPFPVGDRSIRGPQQCTISSICGGIFVDFFQ